MSRTHKYRVGKFAPESLDVRKNAKHNRFESTGNTPTTLDGVSVALSNSEQAHRYSAPSADGAEFRRLRRFGLLLSRYGLVNKNQFAKRRDLPLEIVTAAERVVATEAYRTIYGGDPTVGTTNLVPLAAMLNAPDCPPSTLVHAVSYAGTSAYRELLHMVNDPKVRADLEEVERNITGASYYSELIRLSINRKGTTSTRTTNNAYMEICRRLMWAADSVEASANERKRREEEQRRDKQRSMMGQDNLRRRTPGNMEGKREARKGKVLREIIPSVDGWALALLEKLPLTLPHTGRKGRKLVPMPYGKSIRFMSREDTDPEQRVFSRKTRSKGGIVVVDCSGSMGFGSDDLDRIMASTAGATVLCYSSGMEPQGANIWLVAQNGRRASSLPRFPGNNGVDGPALEYGLSLRRHNEPVVWISDTRVTGSGDEVSIDLRDWCMDFCARHGVYITPNSYEAASLLRQVQMGKKPRLTKFKAHGGINYVR